MKTVEECVDELKRSEELQDEARGIFAEFMLSQTEGEIGDDTAAAAAGGDVVVRDKEEPFPQKGVPRYSRMA